MALSTFDRFWPPPECAHPEVEKVMAVYRRAEAELGEKQRELATIQRKLREEEASLRQKQTNAILSDEKTSATDKRLQELELARERAVRLVSSAEDAVLAAGRQLESAREKYRPEWMALTDQKLEEVRRQINETIDAYEALRLEYVDVEQERAFAAGIGRRFKHVERPMRGSLKPQSGEPWMFGEIVELLRSDAAPPEPKPEVEGRPPTWPTQGVPAIGGG